MTNMYDDFRKVEVEINAVDGILKAISGFDIEEGLTRIKKAYELRIALLQSDLRHEEFQLGSVFSNHSACEENIADIKKRIMRCQEIQLTLVSLG